jgi:hypothetical protein
MISATDSQVKVEIGKYERKIEYTINISRANIEFAKAGCPGTGRLIGVTEENIRKMLDMGKTFELYINGSENITKELGVASEHNIHEIYLGDKDNLEDTIDKFKHVPITLPKNSKEKIIIGYVTLVRDEK